MGNLASNNSSQLLPPQTTIMSREFKHLLFATFGFGFSLLLLVCAQDQSGFISIDCGGTHLTSYNEEVTGLTFISDKDLIETGESNMVAPEYRGILQEPYNSLRSFPKGTRNCYTLNLTSYSKYLIRATFYYGNYDGLNKLPEFELHLGPNLWQTVTFKNLSSSRNHELMHIPLRGYIHVCLVNIGSGVPIISTIETRLLPYSTYDEQLVDQQSMTLVERYDTGQVSPLKSYRYPYDLLDRIWYGYADWTDWTELTASSDIDTYSYDIPSIVLNTAATPKDETGSFVNIWLPDESNDENSTYYIFLHFAEVVKLQPNQSRSFFVTTLGIYVDLETFAFSPKYGVNSIFFNGLAFTGGILNISLIKTENSTLPPILNAFEAYTVMELKGSETNKKDLDSIINIKRTYGIGKNWQGDPCAPQKYSWEVLNCTYPETNDSSRIISLDLSSSGLTEDITRWISDIAMLQTLNLSNNNLSGSLPGFLSQLQNLSVLDLSNNNLTGSIPDTWSQLQKLNVLYLDGNMLTGSVPQGLMLKQSNGFLSLRVCNNPDLSGAFPCEEKKKTKNKPNIFLVVGLPIIGVASIISLIVAVTFLRKRRSKDEAVLGGQPPRNGSVKLEPTRRKFTYSDILKITNNRENKIGDGGFGTVYHGYINEQTQVAVKMLSSSSTRGLEQFHAEVNSLMRVHHTNLASLIGYCEDEDHKGLVYEYMPMGNLQQMLSDKISNVLTWQDRLQIAVDAAQGLEYLHYGCKPPIIHRNIKTTNILISENVRAKISDFGLSRNFFVDNETHITTIVAGTPAYQAPEYKQLSRFNEKSDVYSFGIVLLEIITGRHVVSRTSDRTPIDEWVRSIFPTGDINKIVDPRLNEVFDVNSAWILLEIAMTCISQEASKRPTMTKVVRELKQCLEMQLSQRNPINYQAFEITSENGYSIRMVRPSAR